jgi:iron complex transport system substrate-binding protein
MPTKLILATSIVLIFVGSHLAKQHLSAPSHLSEPALNETSPAPISDRHARRIISMAPSVTETLFALGLGDRVVGVSRFCNYPPEAAQKPRIGGLFDPNFEAIVALHPDLIVLLDGSAENRPAFGKLRLPTLVVGHKSVDGILASITTIGQACGVQPRAEALAADLHARIRRVQAKVAGLPQPRVMFAVERTLGTGKVQDVYVAGADGHLDRIIALAGGQNAYQGTVRFPVVSSEGILKMNPEVIVDMVPRLIPGADRTTLADDWQQLAQVDAVKHNRVFVLDDDYVSVPGPRFILFVEKLARLVHPEADWEGKIAN